MVHGSSNPLALERSRSRRLAGHVEADETFIGGKARNMHMDVRKRRITATGPTDKTAVFGVLERSKGDGTHSKVKTKVITDRKKKTLQAEVKAHVQAGAALYSDALLSYDGLESEYAHQVVDHAVEYVRGHVHTNGLENFWCLFKRGINGTYVSVEPFHLFRYLDEQEFRFNNRGTRENPITDGERFDLAVRQIVGKRLTYAQLTGKEGETAVSNPLRLKRGKRKAVDFRFHNLRHHLRFSCRIACGDSQVGCITSD